jgi:hypothetical protein
MVSATIADMFRFAALPLFVAVLTAGPAHAGAAARLSTERNPMFESSPAMKAAFRKSPVFRSRSRAFFSTPSMRRAFAPSGAFHSSFGMREAFEDTRRVPVIGARSPSSVTTSGSGTREVKWRIGQFSP